MLSEEQKNRIQARFGHYADRQSVVPEALKIVQSERHWVSDEDLRDVAGFLGLSADEVEGVATFYNLIHREPVGRHVILLCDSVVCWMLGYDGLLAHLNARLGIGLGGTTADGRFTLLPAPCLGACDRAPAMMVDGDLHTDLTPGQVDVILERYP